VQATIVKESMSIRLRTVRKICNKCRRMRSK